MRIRIDDIKENGMIRDFHAAVEEFPALREIDETEAVVHPLEIHLRAIRAYDMIEVEGSVQTILHLACSRCLNEFDAPMNIPFALTYTRQLPDVGKDAEDDEEIELDAESMGLILFHGDEIDLHEAIQEQVIMNIPLQPLCDSVCRGLCPQCGIDLNKNKCHCEQPETEFRNRFAALKNFKAEKE